MYLTRMKLDTSKRKCAMALNARNMFHGAIEMAFAERGRKLWRIDKLNGSNYLLLVSDEKPDLCSTVEQFGTEEGWETRSYDHFLASIFAGERRHFRLTANPVISQSGEAGQRGSVVAHVTCAQQEKWLFDRAEKHGFSLLPGEFTVTQSEWVTFRKGKENGRPVTFHAVTFEGTLTVTDPDLFRETLCTGFGREKAYGCGMLTVLGKEK